jgi:hypothetical protein
LIQRQPLRGKKKRKKPPWVDPDTGTALAATPGAFLAEGQIQGYPFL